MATPTLVTVIPVQGIPYYYWSDEKISKNPSYNMSSFVGNPFPSVQNLGDYSVNGTICNLSSNGRLIVKATGKPYNDKSNIKTVSKDTLDAIKQEEEPSVDDIEAAYGKFINDGNYSAKLVAEKKYNFNANDPADSEKISKFIKDMNVISQDGSGLDITNSKLYRSLLASKNLLPPENDDLFTKTFRFGYYNLEAPLSKVKEYLFFTKPDLNILIDRTDPINKQIYKDLDVKTKDIGRAGKWALNPGLISEFWKDMIQSKARIIKCLQSSFVEDNDRDDPFIHLLSNQVITNLEIPELSSEVVETATNRYGTTMFYRGSSEPSDDGLSFSLEFKDTKWLDVYYFFRAYEEYETAKHLGTLVANPKYIYDKILYDQISVYKIVVDLDMETILYWGKYYGVAPISLPRDTFSTDTFDNGISYTIQFKAQFYEDMKPEILSDFNSLNAPLFGQVKSFNQDPTGKGYNKTTSSQLMYDYRPYNPVLGRVDNRPAVSAYVKKIKKSARAKQNPNKYVYKLMWRGVDRY